eukprot:GHUV01052055.1.p1 GENE.GHUV01052055.1~~GHUV01052055.1.p1  ORF type:complete len:112 (-),score=19.23 GHUV01052055.1:3-338(-)
MCCPAKRAPGPRWCVYDRRYADARLTSHLAARGAASWAGSNTVETGFAQYGPTSASSYPNSLQLQPAVSSHSCMHRAGTWLWWRHVQLVSFVLVPMHMCRSSGLPSPNYIP